MFFAAKCGNKTDKSILFSLPFLILAALILILFRPPAALGAEQAVVKNPLVNLRSGPGTGYGLVGSARQGEALGLLGKEGDWYRVSKNGTACWVAGWLVEVRKGPDQAAGPDRVVVKDQVVNLRSGPGTGYGLMGNARQGEALEVLGKEGDWYRVSKNGTACWVAGWLVDFRQGAPQVNPAQTSPSGGTPPGIAEITEDGVNIRGGPGTAYGIVGHAGGGSKFPLLDKSGDWYKVSVNGGSGWVFGQFVRLVAGDSPREAADASGWAVINGSGVNIRNGPGTNFQVVTRANRGDRFLLADSSADWYKIVLSNGNSGWVVSWLVNVEKNPAPGGTSPSEGSQAGGGSSTPTGGGSSAPAGGGTSPAGGLRPPGDGSVSRGGAVIPPASGPAVDKLKSVSARVEGGNTIVTIEAGKGPLSYEVSSITGPDRLIVDLKGMEPGAVPENISLSSTLISGIRVGWFSRNPSSTRVVVDLRQGVRCEKSANGGRLQLILIPRTGRSLAGAKIVLDPGHGGSDPGATGPTGLKEEDVNLDIAQKAAQYLRNAGATVFLTRTGDSYVDLAERANLASKYGAALFVSIHSNANNNSGVSGTSTYYLKAADQGNDQARFEGMYLARCLQSSVAGALKRPDKGVLQADFVVLVRSAVPAALVEVAYISNPEEEKLLRDPAFRDKAGQAVVKGIADYLAAK